MWSKDVSPNYRPSNVIETLLRIDSLVSFTLKRCRLSFQPRIGACNTCYVRLTQWRHTILCRTFANYSRVEGSVQSGSCPSGREWNRDKSRGKESRSVTAVCLVVVALCGRWFQMVVVNLWLFRHARKTNNNNKISEWDLFDYRRCTFPWWQFIWSISWHLKQLT